MLKPTHIDIAKANSLLSLRILHKGTFNEHMLAMCKGTLYQWNLKCLFMLSGVTIYIYYAIPAMDIPGDE